MAEYTLVVDKTGELRMDAAAKAERYGIVTGLCPRFFRRWRADPVDRILLDWNDER